MGLKVDLQGVKQVAAKLRTLSTMFPDRVALALRQEAEIEMTEAKRRTPVDTGKLRASGRVEQPQGFGRQISVKLVFGTDYAVYVHENLEANHPNGGEAKFLESTLNESAPYMAERIARRVKLNQRTREGE